MVVAFPRMIRKRLSGIGWPLNREMLMLNVILAGCMK
jgi:hypothetical protein